MSAEAISIGAQMSDSFYSIAASIFLSIAIFLFSSVIMMFAIILTALILILYNVKE